MSGFPLLMLIATFVASSYVPPPLGIHACTMHLSQNVDPLNSPDGSFIQVAVSPLHMTPTLICRLMSALLQLCLWQGHASADDWKR